MRKITYLHAVFPPVYMYLEQPVAIPENHSVYGCTALLQVVEAPYGFYAGCVTNTLVTLVVRTSSRNY